MFSYAALLLFLPFLVDAAARQSAPAGAITVGSSGQYKTISAAINALSASTTSTQTIFIQPGTYSEAVYIPNTLKSPLIIYGSTPDDTDYSKNTVTITHSSSLSQAGSDDKTGTLRAWNNNFKLYNVNIVNSYGKGEQAIALSAYGDQQGYYACQIKGYQDTVLSNQGHQVFGKTYIEGAVDYIFGQKAVAWFDDCTINSIGAGAITASGRNDTSNPSYYVINKSTVTGSGSGTAYLGRPWGDYARVIFQNTNLGAVVNSKGWEIWNVGQERTDHVDYEEYGNTGAGASGTRASFSKKANKAYSLSSIMGGTSWIDSAYVTV